MPRATVIAVVVVGVLYFAVALTSVLVLGPALGDSPAPLADLLAIGVGGPVREITAVVAVLLTLGAVNAYLAGASQLGAALARDGALPGRVFGSARRSLTFIGVASLVALALPISLHRSMLMVTGCFTLVYVLGMAAAVRLLPPGVSRVGAGVAFVSVLGLLGLNGWPALLSLAIAAAAVLYVSTRPALSVSTLSTRSARIAMPSSIRVGSTAPNPSTRPDCVVK